MTERIVDDEGELIIPDLTANTPANIVRNLTASTAEKSVEFANLIKDSLLYTLCFEAAIFLAAEDMDEHDRFGTSRPHDPIGCETGILSSIATGTKIAVSSSEQLRPYLMAYEGVVFSLMLLIRYKMGPFENWGEPNSRKKK